MHDALIIFTYDWSCRFINSTTGPLIQPTFILIFNTLAIRKRFIKVKEQFFIDSLKKKRKIAIRHNSYLISGIDCHE